MLDMKRRDFITLLGGAAAWPLASRAQQGERMRRIGVLNPWAENDPEVQAQITAFSQALQKLGWTEHNLRIDYRWGEANRCSKRPGAYRLSSRPLVIRPAAASSQAWRILAATSLALPLPSSRCMANIWNCSKRSRPTLFAWP